MADPATTSSHPNQTICRSCGTVVDRNRRIVTGIAKGIGFFLLTPFVAVIVALILGAEAVHENSMFLAIVWVAIGIPSAGKAISDGFKRNCPSCGADAMVQLASPEGAAARSDRPNVDNLTGHTGRVLALAALPDGHLASGSADGTIRVWDIAARAEIVVWTGHDDDVTGVAALPDGRVVSGSKDKTVRIWDRAASSDPIVLTGHTEKVTAVTGLPDGRVASADKRHVIVWDPSRAGGAPTEFDLGKFGAEALVATPDGRIVVSGWQTDLKIIDPSHPGETTTHAGHIPPIHSLALLPDGRVACGEGQHTVRLIEIGRPGATSTLHGGEGSVTAIAVFPDGRIATSSLHYEDRLVRVWDLENPTASAVIKTGALAMAALSDGRLATSGQEKTIHLWDVPETPAPTAPAPVAKPKVTPVPERAPEPVREHVPVPVARAAASVAPRTTTVTLPPPPPSRERLEDALPVARVARTLVTPSAPARRGPSRTTLIAVVATAMLVVVAALAYSVGRERSGDNTPASPRPAPPAAGVAPTEESSPTQMPAPAVDPVTLVDTDTKIVVEGCGIFLTYLWVFDPATAPPTGSEVFITLKDARGNESVQTTRTRRGRIWFKYSDGILNGGGTWSATIVNIGGTPIDWPPLEATYDQPC